MTTKREAARTPTGMDISYIPAVKEEKEMKLSVVDINVLVQDSVRGLAPAGEQTVLRTALAAEELKVILDPTQMGEGLSALLDSVSLTLPKGEVVTIGTSFLPIPHASGSKGGEKTAGCALLYVDLGASTPENRTVAYKEGFKKLLLAFRGVLGAVKKINGCARIFTGRGSRARFNIYLPLIDRTASTPAG